MKNVVCTVMIQPYIQEKEKMKQERGERKRKEERERRKKETRKKAEQEERERTHTEVKQILPLEYSISAYKQ